MTAYVHMTQGVSIVISDVRCHKVYRLACFVIVVCNRCSLANTSSVPTPAFYVHLHTIEQQLALKHLIQLHSSPSLPLKLRCWEDFLFSWETSLSFRSSKDMTGYSLSYLSTIQGTTLSWSQTHL